jgi:hypothetical protein
MKLLLSLCLLLCTLSTTIAQSLDLSCFDDMMQEARNLIRQEKYVSALRSYDDALICPSITPRQRQIIKARKEAIRQKIIQQTQDLKQTQKKLKQSLKKISAGKIRSDSIRRRLYEEQQKKDSIFKINARLVDAFYFYQGKYALAFKNQQFYFVNQQGYPIKKLGYWDDAKQFDHQLGGLAEVQLADSTLYLDTTGIVYHLSKTDLSDLRQEYQQDQFAKLQNRRDLERSKTQQGKKNAFKYRDTLNLRRRVTDLKNKAKHVTLVNASVITNAVQKLLKMPYLTGINFINCRTLPKKITQFTKLESLNLNLGYNARRQAMDFFMRLEVNKDSLWLQPQKNTNTIAELPEWIGKLKKLQVLVLHGCHKLTNLPATLGQLTNLQVLNLNGCKHITHLPTTISKLKKLRVLELNKCSRLVGLPSTITQLESLDDKSFINLIKIVTNNLSYINIPKPPNLKQHFAVRKTLVKLSKLLSTKRTDPNFAFLRTLNYTELASDIELLYPPNKLDSALYYYLKADKSWETGGSSIKITDNSMVQVNSPKNDIARIYFELKNYSEAVKWQKEYLKVLNHSGRSILGDISAQETLALYYLYNNKFIKAASIAQALLGNPFDGSVRITLAHALLFQGLFDNAKENYRLAFEKGGHKTKKVIVEQLRELKTILPITPFRMQDVNAIIKMYEN